MDTRKWSIAWSLGVFFGSQRFCDGSQSWCWSRSWAYDALMNGPMFWRCIYDHFRTLGHCEACTMSTPEFEDLLNHVSTWGQFRQSLRPALLRIANCSRCAMHKGHRTGVQRGWTRPLPGQSAPLTSRPPGFSHYPLELKFERTLCVNVLMLDS